MTGVTTARDSPTWQKVAAAALIVLMAVLSLTGNLLFQTLDDQQAMLIEANRELGVLSAKIENLEKAVTQQTATHSTEAREIRRRLGGLERGHSHAGNPGRPYDLVIPE